MFHRTDEGLSPETETSGLCVRKCAVVFIQYGKPGEPLPCLLSPTVVVILFFIHNSIFVLKTFNPLS